jgi:hypothetical protein
VEQFITEVEKHYGYTESAHASAYWEINENTLERLKLLPEALDPKKKIRVTFDYDPDFPRALIQVWDGVRDFTAFADNTNS